MKKDLIFAPIMLLVGVALFLLRYTGMTVHIAISVVGILVLAAYTFATKKEWKIPALEIAMRVVYGIALISGIIIKISYVAVLAILHKILAVLFVIALAFLFAHKIVVSKKA